MLIGQVNDREIGAWTDDLRLSFLCSDSRQRS
jgi:hypothetical protein